MTVKKRNLTNSEREAILREVLLHSNGNYLVRLPNGLSQTLAAKYNCHPATVRRVLALAKGQGVANGNMKVSVASKKKGRVGRKKAYTAEKVYYKMFLSAVARPRYVEATGKWWDGKLGTWPFVDSESVQAERSSFNREAGTYETKSINVTKDVYRSFLVGKVLPAIVAKWPCDEKIVKLQHDNARAHYPYVRLDRTFMTLQACLVETIRLMGDNTYKVPHMSKEKKERKGLLPKNVMCPRDVYAAAKNQLLAVDGAELD
ncbi:hypothetical protein DYB30_011531 [Aphanomyces astaci]|uniref:Tc3 transposase DNA binding domain-containing protein n=1 Tax=Aphanomyces astaci TaxID=112090 RepID=A0A397CKB0_APHAT|nr:hypothetical protein DYB30_011531 [Aphanomyces astaci]